MTQKRRKLPQRKKLGAAVVGLAISFTAVLLFANYSIRTEKQQPVPIPVPPAPQPAVIKSVEVPKPRALPKNALRQNAKERERVAQRLHEFGLKRELFATRGVAGHMTSTQEDLESAAARSSTFATVLTSDHSQHMISYTKLTGDCPELSKIHGRAALKLNADGQVIDGAYLPDSAPIPKDVIGCQVGKPSDLAANEDPNATFVTIYMPGLQRKN
jgi:hypothetical protein